MKSVPIVILGLLATVGAATRGGAHVKHEPARQSEAAGRAVTTTIESVVQRGNISVLVLREPSAKLIDVKVPASTSIGTQNADRIAASDLRSGDRLVLQHNGGMQDVSQRTVDVSGVVAYAPLSNDDVMTVQITPARTVLVDVAPQTRFTDRTRKETSPTDVVDADTVSVHGVLDTTIDEIVVAQAIERLGPKISRTYTSG
jgi:hypothetical protein